MRLKFSSFGRTVVVLAAVLVLLGALVGCSGATEPADTPAVSAPESSVSYPLTVADDAGREVTIAAEPQRIVSLAPANTETVFALGAGARVIGVTTYDDYPAEVEAIEKVGDFTGPNLEAIAALNPDLVLLTGGVQAEVIKQLEDLGATALVLDPLTIDGVKANISKLGQVLNAVDDSDAVVADMNTRLEAVAAEAAAFEQPITCFIEIGNNPLFTAGTDTMINEAMSLAGGVNVVTEAGWVPYSTEQVFEDDPSVYFVTSMSGAVPADIAERSGHEALSAVKSGLVVEIEDNLISRPGPRIVEGVEAMLQVFKTAAGK